MNNTRRKDLSKVIESLECIKGRIEELLEEEQEYFDNMPENLQESERAESSQAAIDNMESAVESMEECLEYLEEAGV